MTSIFKITGLIPKKLSEEKMLDSWYILIEGYAKIIVVLKRKGKWKEREKLY
jgi:hypothetical protein